eukprot:symbB.v1.2.032422.t1/scaffold3892.1/size69949/1
MDDARVQQLLANTTVRLRPEWLPSQRDASDSNVLLRQLLAADLRDACE